MSLGTHVRIKLSMRVYIVNSSYLLIKYTIVRYIIFIMVIIMIVSTIQTWIKYFNCIYV